MVRLTPDSLTHCVGDSMSRRDSLDVSEKSVYPTGNRKAIPREGPKNLRTASIMIAGVLGEVLTGQLRRYHTR